MDLHFVGGPRDGLVIDTDDPGNWGGVPEGPPLDNEVEFAFGEIYWLTSATPDRGTYEFLFQIERPALVRFGRTGKRPTFPEG